MSNNIKNNPTEKAAAEKAAAEKAAAEKAAAEKAAAEKAAAEKAAADKKALEGTFIMTVGHLSWGHGGKNHFYADKKPLITAKVMGNYANKLLEWLEAGWIKKGSYK